MNKILIDSEIGYWGITAEYIKNKLDDMSGDITVEINSPGGSVFEGITIFNHLKSYDKGEITVVITGLAASMASYIALAGDKLKVYDNATYMIHNAWMYTYGDHNKLQKDSNTLKGLSSILKKAYVAATGKKDEAIQFAMDDETYYFGKEIVEFGFADEVIETVEKKDKEQSLALANESFKSCMQSIKVKTLDKDSELEKVATLLATMPSAKEKIAFKKTKEEDMSKTYTQEDFEALNTANQKALADGIANAQADERERVAGIMALNGDMDTKMKAIKDGLSVGNCAIALNKAANDNISAQKQSFEEASKALEGNITKEVESNIVDPVASDIDDDDKAYYEAKVKGAING